MYTIDDKDNMTTGKTIKHKTNKMKTNKMTTVKTIAFAAAMALGLSACSDRVETPSVPAAPTASVVKTRLAAFEGAGQTLEGENTVTDLRACLFVDGTLAKVYTLPVTPDGGCDLQLERHAGTLYVVANTEGLIDFGSLVVGSLSESDWLKHTVETEAAAPAHFFSGSLVLDGLENTQTELPVTLKRGLARFDLQIRTAGKASVSSITLKNAARSAYLFPVAGDLSPADVSRGDVAAAVTEPLTEDTPAVLYAYEQENDALEVEIVAEIDGQVKTLTKQLGMALERNKIYTLTVRKDVIDVSLDLSFDEWEPGGDTELTPARR